jgi:hypothetical protein
MSFGFSVFFVTVVFNILNKSPGTVPNESSGIITGYCDKNTDPVVRCQVFPCMKSVDEGWVGLVGMRAYNVIKRLYR